MAKQLLPLNSKKSMIQETVERLSPLARPKQFWIITNQDLRPAIVRQLRGLPTKQIVAEPAGRNTAPAIGLAAFLLERNDPNAVIGMFPSDHVITNEKNFREDIAHAARIAAGGENIVVIGISPTRAETGYGYIEVGSPSQKGVLQVRRFTEKPVPEVAEQFVKAGNFFWNSGMFVWSARTLANALREHLPNTAPLLEKIAASYGSRSFEKTFAKLYPQCENISIDYAVLEPRSKKGEGSSGIYCIPANFGWNDLGSWTALYEHRSAGMNDREQRHQRRAKLYAQCRRKLHPLNRKVRRSRRRRKPGCRRNRRCVADHYARACAGRRQSGEASGREEAQAVGVKRGN